MTLKPQRETLYRTARLRRDIFFLGAGTVVAVEWLEFRDGRNIYRCSYDGQVLGEADDVFDLEHFLL